MPLLIYDTDEQRHAAKLAAKRKWRKENRAKIHTYNRSYYSEHKEEKEVLPTRDFLIKNWKRILKDLKSLSKTAVASKWGTSRRTLGRLITELEN